MKIPSPLRFGRVIVVASALTMVAPAMFPEVAQATVEDQRREVERIVDELDRLHTQADILAEDYAEAVDTKNQLGIEIVAAEQRVADKEAELNSLRGDLAEVAIRAFTGNGADVLGPLFSNANQYGEGLRRDQYSRVALSVGTSTTDDLDELISDLDAERKDLESKRAQAEALTLTIADKQQQTESLTAEYIQSRDSAQARLGRLIEEEEQRRAEAAFARLQAELAAQQAAAASASASNSGGGNTGGGGTASGGSNATTSSGGGGNNSNNSNSSSGGGSTPAPAPVVNLPSVSGRAGLAIQAAQGQLGVSYRYATSKPGVSFDCSGLTHYAWGQAGVYLPRNSRCSSSRDPAGSGCCRPAGRPDLLLLADQSCRDLRRRWTADPRSQLGHRGEGLERQLGQGHGGRPPRLTQRRQRSNRSFGVDVLRLGGATVGLRAGHQSRPGHRLAVRQHRGRRRPVPVRSDRRRSLEPHVSRHRYIATAFRVAASADRARARHGPRHGARTPHPSPPSVEPTSPCRGRSDCAPMIRSTKRRST